MPPTDPWFPSLPHEIRAVAACVATAVAAWLAFQPEAIYLAF